MKSLLLVWIAATTAHAQFQLFSIRSGVESPVPAAFDCGTLVPGDTATATFRVRNIGTTAASLSALSVAGAGFSLSGAPALPISLDPQKALDFGVRIQGDSTGLYSANLSLPGASVILTATVVPGLLYRAGPFIDFGTVTKGTTASVHVIAENHSPVAVEFPPLTIQGTAFTVHSAPSPGTSVDPQQSAGFDVQFAPIAAGSYTGSLTAGNRTFTLAGIATVPPAYPQISIDLPQAASGQQGTVRVALDGTGSAGGTLQLDFDGPPDPAVAFANGGRAIGFKTVAGQAVTAQFQTGTTAGNLVFTVLTGAVTAQQIVRIAPAEVAVTASQGTRSPGAIAVQVTGFDNTRTAGALAFDFYDRTGNLIAPSPIQATADFASFFQNSGVGGLFLLKAVFPVYGDASQIAAFDVQMTNAAGITKTARISF